jgi:hypothetical protein
MSCGTKIEGRFHLWSEREELADKLERDGEYRLARSIRRQECLDDRELRQAEHALERQGLSKHFDFREERCACRTEEDGW